MTDNYSLECFIKSLNYIRDPFKSLSKVEDAEAHLLVKVYRTNQVRSILAELDSGKSSFISTLLGG